MAAMTPDERHQLGHNGRQFALQEFGRSQLMNRLEALLQEAMVRAKAII
jgi:hypothetical protein